MGYRVLLPPGKHFYFRLYVDGATAYSKIFLGFVQECLNSVSTAELWNTCCGTRAVVRLNRTFKNSRALIAPRPKVLTFCVLCTRVAAGS